ncbi:MAG TPA: hypothetical protein VJU16_02130, partial [Planctomycetota bacterium]|nr:hypothetical protein [Planctomycetota bacterium]
MTRIMRRGAVLALAALVAVAPRLVAQEGGQDPGKKVLEAKDLVNQIQARGNMLVERLKEKSPQVAERLKKALLLINEETVREKLDEVLSELRKNNPDNAADQADQVVKSLEKILAILEDRMSEEEKKKEVAALEAIKKELDEIIKKQQEAIDKTKDLDKDRGKEYEQILKDINEVMAKQKELLQRTEEGPPRELMQQLGDAVKEIEKLKKEQEEAFQAAEKAKSAELRAVGEMTRKLDDLIKRQDRLKAETAQADKRRSGLDKALKDLDRVLDRQKKALEATKQAVTASDPSAKAK